MVSRFELPIDLTKSTTAKTLKEYKSDKFQWKTKFPMYVRKYMSTMKSDKMRTEIERISNMVFANKKNRPRISSAIIHTQNYLTVTFRDDPSYVTRISKIRIVNNGLQMYVPKGTKFRMKFLNGKIRKGIVNTKSIDQDFTPIGDISGDNSINYIHPAISARAIVLTNNENATEMPGFKNGGAVIELVNGELRLNGYGIPNTSDGTD